MRRRQRARARARARDHARKNALACMIDGQRTMQLMDWWIDRHLYNILPNRVYFLLGAQISDSDGEFEWDMLHVIMNLPPLHWCSHR